MFQHQHCHTVNGIMQHNMHIARWSSCGKLGARPVPDHIAQEAVTGTSMQCWQYCELTPICHLPACLSIEYVTHLSTTFMSVHRIDYITYTSACRYLLPPIIFYAGISVKKKQFFRNFASIAIFGVLGTYIAFAVIACVLYAFSKLPNVLNFSVSNAMLFATTISARETCVRRNAFCNTWGAQNIAVGCLYMWTI